MLARQMLFAAVSRICEISSYQVQTICERYVELALEQADFSQGKALSIDETSRAKGHDYITLAVDADERRVLAVTAGRGAATVAVIAGELAAHGCPSVQIESASIDISPAFIKGCARSQSNARVIFDKFDLALHGNAAVDKTRCIEQRSDLVLRSALKGMRWTLLKEAFSLSAKAAGAALHGLIRAPRLTRTARARAYKERLRKILDRKPINVVPQALRHCTGA